MIGFISRTTALTPGSLPDGIRNPLPRFVARGTIDNRKEGRYGMLENGCCAREEWIGGYLPEKSTPNSFTAWKSTVDWFPLTARAVRVYALNCKRACVMPQGVGGSFKLRTSRTFCIRRLSCLIQAVEEASLALITFEHQHSLVSSHVNS